jgi:uncharacterized OB-fold protein
MNILVHDPAIDRKREDMRNKQIRKAIRAMGQWECPGIKGRECGRRIATNKMLCLACATEKNAATEEVLACQE